MANLATERITEIVRAAKDSAKAAEDRYDEGSIDLTLKSGRGIDLLGGHAVSQTADIARSARRLCDDLYVAYQTLIPVVDAQCRPLLEQQPDWHAVRAVRDLIQWLNDESEIENNFSASLGSTDLGEFASVRYIPKIENKLIQGFWESTYAMWPGRAEDEQREIDAAETEARERAIKNRKLHQQMLAQLPEQEAEMQRMVKQWETDCEETMQSRKNFVAQSLAQLRKQLESSFEDTFQNTRQQIEDEKRALRAKIQQTEEAMNKLSVLKIGEKSRLKKQIEALNMQFYQADARLTDAKHHRGQAVRNMEEQLKKREEQLIHEAQQYFPIPEDPRLAALSPNQKLKRALVTTLRQIGQVKADALFQQCPEAKGVEHVRLQSLLRQMVGTEVIRVECKGMTFYKAAPEMSPKAIKQKQQQQKDGICAFIREMGESTYASVERHATANLFMTSSQFSSMLFDLEQEGAIYKYERHKSTYYKVLEGA